MQSEQQKPVSQRLWLVGIIADVAAVVTLVASSTGDVAVVLGLVALLLGTVQLVASFGKPVDRWVVLAVVGIVAGAVTVTVVVTRGVVDTSTKASGSAAVPSTTVPATTAKPSASSTTSEPPSSTTPPPVPVTSTKSPAEKRVSNRPVLLTDGYSVDLDSDSLDWGSKRGSVYLSEEADLGYDLGSLTAIRDMAPVKPDATFDDCVTAGYRRSSSGAELRPGKAFCVKTTEGAFARVVIIHTDTRDQIAMNVLVWHPSAPK
ncbi:hypothetical protein [Allokutzneria oryzae]|uniref:Serine/threonine protein kinase n=1 Tax=Allokutzneria oryzae TaxID=1378989 RepID=A0ABV6A1E0_9PSEU